MRGFDVIYLTGTDEHGQKIERKAEEKGVTPQQYVDDIVQELKNCGKSWIFLMMTLFGQQRTRHKEVVAKDF